MGRSPFWGGNHIDEKSPHLRISCMSAKQTFYRNSEEPLFGEYRQTLL
jgi:hypothetical protein